MTKYVKEREGLFLFWKNDGKNGGKLWKNGGKIVLLFTLMTCSTQNYVIHEMH